MGTDFFNVTTLAKTGTSISLRLVLVCPDFMHVPGDESFALMMLREASNKSSLASDVSFEDTMKAAWMKKYARGYIKSVKVSKIANKPPKAALDDYDHAYWKKEPWMSAQLDITVTDPAWIEHVKKGTKWTSRAFSETSQYDDRPPIRPGDASTETDDTPFLWVPREVYFSKNERLPELPDVLEMLAYADRAYQPVDKIEKAQLTPKKLRDLLGRAVIVNGTHAGTLIAAKGTTWARLGTYNGCGGGFAPVDVEWVARAELKPKVRLGVKVEQQSVLEATPAIARMKARTGKKLVVAVRMPPGGKELTFESESDILMLLLEGAAPRTPSSSSRDPYRSCPLSQEFGRDQKKYKGRARRDQAEEVVPWVAKKYIASWKLDMPEVAPVTLNGNARAVLEAPWPTATLTIETTSAKWIEHWTDKIAVEVAWNVEPPTAAPVIT